ncbi:hypothetical protein CCYA_CCYA05G1622 [Cyanidiococcus yangmingshanensis]|nr:hypothetical protein CCYA_CCYA05G1622 [Cyanidiococcus yangmingshanensis]
MIGFVFSVTSARSLSAPSRFQPLISPVVGSVTLSAKRSRARQVVRACVSDTETSQGTPKLHRQLARFAERATMPLLGMVVATPGFAEAAETSESTLKSLFKSLPLSLVHPMVMDGMLLTTFYVFYLGFRARTLRTTSDKELKLKIARSKPGERHYQLASILLAVMTVTTFEGMANTYTRTGKLFPGPHLYIGLSTVALMSVMASLAPAMRQGSTTARNVHFALAFAVTGGFLWQLQSGFEIVLKLLGWK